MPKQDLNKYEFSRSWVKGQVHRLTKSLGYQDKAKTELQGIGMVILLRQPRLGHTFDFQDRLMPQLTAILDDCEIGIKNG